MNKYNIKIFNNGRFVIFENKDYIEAVRRGKEILICCGGNNYSYIIGSQKSDYHNNRYSHYSDFILDKVLDERRISKLYRIILSRGIEIFMQTGYKATTYEGNYFFIDTESDWEGYKRSSHCKDWNISSKEYDKLRYLIDIKMTYEMFPAKTDEERDEIGKVIYPYLHRQNQAILKIGGKFK